jgi:pimeloyl-ACP methyl ester carboxylesterase
MTAPAPPPAAPVEDLVEATGGVRLALRRWEPGSRQGPGPVPVLCVHGLASNARLWDGVAARLAGLGHPVAAVDLRGHGRSDKPDEGYGFATIAADLAAVLAGLGWSATSATAGGERPLVAGQSWGANVVLELAIRHPDAARAVVCIDGGTIELSAQFPTWDRARAALAPPPLAGMPAADFEKALRAMHPDWPESGIQGALANVEVRHDGTVAPWLTLERHLAILRELWGHRPSERYPLVPVPVLLVPADNAAGADTAWPAARRAAVAKAEAAIPTVRTRWLSGDHDLHAQYPATVAGLLDEACRPGFWT